MSLVGKNIKQTYNKIYFCTEATRIRSTQGVGAFKSIRMPVIPRISLSTSYTDKRTDVSVHSEVLTIFKNIKRDIQSAYKNKKKLSDIRKYLRVKILI